MLNLRKVTKTSVFLQATSNNIAVFYFGLHICAYHIFPACS